MRGGGILISAAGAGAAPGAVIVFAGVPAGDVLPPDAQAQSANAQTASAA